MKMTLNFNYFMDNLPESRYAQFSYDGWKALFNYLSEIEEETGEDFEFDPISLCCEYEEYETAREAAKDHGMEDEEEDEKRAKEWLRDRTAVIELLSGGVVIAQF